MRQQQRLAFLLISFSLCAHVAITQNACGGTPTPCGRSATAAGAPFKIRPRSPNNRPRRSPGRGLTWDACAQDADCRSPRTCRRQLKNGNSRACDSRRACLCDVTADLATACIDDSQCPRGEFCYMVFKAAAGNCFSRRASALKYVRPRRKRRKRRVSKRPGLGDNAGGAVGEAEYTVTPTPSSQGLGSKSDGDNGTAHENVPEGGRFCIGVNCLTHLSRGELKFEHDIEARVLCDEFDSCATGGHVVMVNGSGMMMSSYCKVAKCYERVMLVNSPKEAKSVRVKSKTEGLLFTGYSARYGTKVEEAMFGLVTKLGL